MTTSELCRAGAFCLLLPLLALLGGCSLPTNGTVADTPPAALRELEAGPAAETVLRGAGQSGAAGEVTPAGEDGSLAGGDDADGRVGTIALSTDDPGVMSELARVQEALLLSRSMNARLQRQIEDRDAKLAAKDADMTRMQLQIQEFDKKAAELEKKLAAWQKDVLGFREEIRDMNRAQAQILEKVVTLLQGLKGGPPQSGTDQPNPE